jgi:hypothetical protein
VIGAGYGRDVVDPGAQAVLDQSITTNAAMFLPRGVAAGIAVVLFLGLPILFSRR